MDKSEALRIAENFVEKIQVNYKVSQAFLFGSYAKGTNHSESDIDIALIINNVPDIIDAQIDLMKFRRGFDLRIEPHPFMLKDFTNSNPVVSEIIKYGIALKLNNRNF